MHLMPPEVAATEGGPEKMYDLNDPQRIVLKDAKFYHYGLGNCSIVVSLLRRNYFLVCLCGNASLNT